MKWWEREKPTQKSLTREKLTKNSNSTLKNTTGPEFLHVPKIYKITNATSEKKNPSIEKNEIDRWQNKTKKWIISIEKNWIIRERKTNTEISYARETNYKFDFYAEKNYRPWISTCAKNLQDD